MDYRTLRILKNEKCLACNGKIGYFWVEDAFKCLSCNRLYDPSEDRAKEARQKFWASPKGREIQKIYFKTEKGKLAQDRYQQSVKGQLTLRRYYYSNKGQEAHQRHQTKVKTFKKIDKWLKENPDKTIQDALLALDYQPTTGRGPIKENHNG